MNTISQTIIYEQIVGIAKRDTIIQAREIDSWFDIARQTANNLATTLTSLPHAYYFPRIAANFTEEYDFIENVFIGFADGSIINGIGWTPTDAGQDLQGTGWGPWEYWVSTERPWFMEAYIANEIIITEPYLSFATGNITVAMAKWIPELVGVGASVGFSLSMGYILDKIHSHPAIMDGHVMLIGSNNEIVFHSNPVLTLRSSGELKNLQDIPNGSFIIDNITEGIILAEFHDIDLGSSYLIITPIEAVDWNLIAVLPTSITRIPARQYQMAIIMPVVFVLASLLVFTALFVLRLTKDMEEKRVTEKKLRSIINNMPLVANIIDKDFNVVECNEKAPELFRLRDKHEYIKKFAELQPFLQPDKRESIEKAFAMNAIAFETGQNRFEWMHQQINGEPIPCEVTLVRVNWQGKTHLLSFVRDLREFYKYKEIQKEMFVKLEAAVKREQAASRAKSNFLSNMSHEIKTPMNAIVGMTEIAQNTNDPQKQERCFNKIKLASKQLLGIINQILDMSKIEDDKFDLHFHLFEFEKMLTDILNIQRFMIEEKHLAFEVNIDKDIQQFIVSDEIRLMQVITNLLTNAIKFTPEGGKVSFSARQLTDNNKINTLRIEVSDTGIGISSQNQSNLFRAFEQAYTESTREYGGTGLGLAISKHIIELMGGKIWVESELGKGATFIFTIPLNQKTGRNLQSEAFSN
ncbi:MAG: ATP-binding protein [Treponema sp.]|nr:ATP-binding protein [Treponema sp.]